MPPPAPRATSWPDVVRHGDDDLRLAGDDAAYGEAGSPRDGGTVDGGHLDSSRLGGSHVGASHVDSSHVDSSQLDGDGVALGADYAEPPPWLPGPVGPVFPIIERKDGADRG